METGLDLANGPDQSVEYVVCATCRKATATLMLVPWSEEVEKDFDSAKAVFLKAKAVCKDCDGVGVVELFQLPEQFQKVIVSDLDGKRISCKPRKIVDRKEVSPWRIRQKLAITSGDSGFRVHPNANGIKSVKDPRHQLKGK